MIKEAIFSIIGGLGLFIYGIKTMSDGLRKASGDRMRRILSNLTNNPFKGVLAGAGITSLIQSSSVTTVMVVGFVNASLMTLRQALGVIFGANIGTTVTAQLVAFKLTSYALPIIGLGMLIMFAAKKRDHKHVGEFLFGFGVLFLGLNFMTAAIKPFAQDPGIKDLFVRFSASPLMGILLGAAVTAVIQSSSVTTGMVLALAAAGLVDLRGAIPLMLGCNIGTCVTAMLASIGTHLWAKRAALAHLIFNVGGVLLFLPFLRLLEGLGRASSDDLMRQIANANTLFNVILTFLYIPFIGLFVRLLTYLLKGEEGEEVESLPRYLEPHLLATPALAIEAATREIIRTLGLTEGMVRRCMDGFFSADPRRLEKISQTEDAVDSLREAITDYLVRLMQQELSPEESKKIPALIHVINDVERIGDHAENLMALAEKSISSGMSLSPAALQELREMCEEVLLMIGSARRILETGDIREAYRVLDREEVVNKLRNRLKDNHVMRLERKQCHVLSGIIFLDTVSNLEKIGDHLTNVAQKVIEELHWDSGEHASHPAA
ncbi:MAG: Na/Pi cotransporter family protein [Deltaproteobacteria bacterium]